ncbi:beta strand repeat-containing protein [Pseudomonas ogarae]|uniref:beta strand repeat-containing protein n=1 Tax=Pseudomonas TaxID=286 RepID=UPI0039A64FCE
MAYADATAPTAPSVTVAANADGSLVVSGSAEPNSTVTVTYPDGNTATVVAGTDGSYSVTSPVDQPTGDVTANASDAAANTSADTVVAYADTIAPTVTTSITTYTDNQGTLQGTLASGSSTDDTTPVLNGSLSAALSAGEVVRIYEGGTLLGTATVAGTTWTFATATLVNGSSHTYTAVVADAAGNEGTVSSGLTLTVDTTAPTVTTSISSYTDNQGTLQGTFASGSSTDDTTPVLNGSLSAALSAGEVVRIYEGSTLLGAATVTGTTWTFALPVVAIGTSHTYTAAVADAAGNEGAASASFTLSVNATATLAALTIDTAGAISGNYSTNDDAVNTDLITRGGAPVLNGTISRALQADEVVQISLDGGTTWIDVESTDGATTWSYTPAVYTVSTTLTAQTRIQNVVSSTFGSVVNTTYTVDLVAPALGLTSPDFSNAATVDSDNDKTIVSSATPSFSSTVDGTAEAGVTVALVNDVNNDGVYTEGVDTILTSTTASGAGAWTMSATLAVGEYHLGYVLWDAAGNRTHLTATTQVDVVNTLDHLAATASALGTNATNGFGGSMTLNAAGLWTFVGDQAVYSSTDIGAYTTTTLTQAATGSGVISSYAFVDYDLDGFTDIWATNSTSDTYVQLWKGNASGYTASAVQVGLLGTPTSYGTPVVIDMDGDSYLDVVFAGASSASFFLKNNGGTSWTAYGNSDPATGTPMIDQLQLSNELSGVDLNNDGKVDLAVHLFNNNLAFGYGLNILTNNGSSSTTGANWTQGQTVANVFSNGILTTNSTDVMSITWADFNGDGWLDLYVNQTNVATITASRVYLNNSGTIATTGVAIAGDTLAGDASVAVDWNGDGRMDAIEADYATGQVNVYTNNGSITTGSWTTNTLITAVAGVDNVLNSLTVADYDWDGDIDLLVGQSAAAATRLITNTNQVTDGTALHLRILNAEGFNIYYGNTVQVYNSAGTLVATQILNAQSGVWVNDSTGLLNLYGLNSSETYTVRLLASTGTTSETYSWSVTTGDATDAQILTTTEVTAAAPITLTGTGYDDTYVATNVTGGVTSYNGSGGWSDPVLAGETPTWSATGGMDIVDFSSASSAVTVNLSTGSISGWGTLTSLSNVEGVRGSSLADTITGSSADNLIEGRGGNDTIVLASGGNDRLVYNSINGSDTATGGNGSDTVTGFTVGNLASSTSTDADIIDLSGLLQGYTGTAYVHKDGSTGNYVLDAASTSLSNYLQVTTSGSDTLISVDTNGAASFTAPLLTLQNVQTDLATLLANNQLTVV